MCKVQDWGSEDVHHYQQYCRSQTCRLRLQKNKTQGGNMQCISAWAEPPPRFWVQSIQKALWRPMESSRRDPALLTPRTQPLNPSRGDSGRRWCPQSRTETLAAGALTLHAHSPPMTRPPGQFPKCPWTKLDLVSFALVLSSQNTSLLSTGQE